MNTSNEPGILEHEYDGIREYDNLTPGWWHLIFMGSIVFAGFYTMVWHFSPVALSPQEVWKKDQVEDYKRVFGAVGDLQPTEATILTMMGDSKMMEVARSTFQAQCAVCHGKEGGGINGANLTDESFKNVKTIEDIFTTITKGANLGAMPSWERTISQNERIILSSYVASLRGKNIGGRAPEGVAIAPWPAIPASASPATTTPTSPPTSPPTPAAAPVPAK